MKILLATCCLALFAGACQSSSSPPAGPPAFKHAAFFQDLQVCAEEFLLVDGNWMEDFDDAAFYGLAFYARAGLGQANSQYQQWAQDALQRNLQVVREADFLTGDVDEIIMAALGLVDYMAATGDLEGLADLDAMLGHLMDLVDLLGGYLTPDLVPGYAMDTYGPTAINGLMALVLLQRAYLLDDADDRIVEFGAQVVEAIDQRAWNGSAYDFDDGSQRPGLFLYPNATMIILQARLYQLTNRKAHLDRARAIHAGIQPLKVSAESGLVGPGRYRSPYSAIVMGAQTDDYTTLSSQCYLMLALMMLYQITDEPAWILEMDPVLTFIEQTLQGNSCRSDIHLSECEPVCAEGQACLKEQCFDDHCMCGVLHHWMDGRLAVPTDPEFFCSGCNLQLLYIMWYRQHMLN